MNASGIDRQTERLRFSYRGQVLTADSRNIQVNGTLAGMLFRALEPAMNVYMQTSKHLQARLFYPHIAKIFTSAVDKEDCYAE